MFYCEECRTAHKWPKSLFPSYGLCEVCGAKTGCYNIPATFLPTCGGNK